MLRPPSRWKKRRGHVAEAPVFQFQTAIFSIDRRLGGIALFIVKDARVVKIDGVAPRPENIKSGRYLLFRKPMLVSQGKPAGEARLFIDFVLSPEGQKIVKRMGYIPISD